MKLKLLKGDVFQLSTALNLYDTVFADPPDNIGLGYDEYKDNLDDYEQFLTRLVQTCTTHANTTYISFNARWTSMMGYVIHKAQSYYPELEDKWLIQAFTFGQHNKYDFGNNHRPIVRLSKPGAFQNPDAIRVESERMKIGDKRANPAGRVPGDVFFPSFLEYARVTGNSKQRRAWHPTQLHEGLVEDCLLYSTPPEGKVLDFFSGTGTTMRVCKHLGLTCTSVELDSGYCEKIAEENELQLISEGIWHG